MKNPNYFPKPMINTKATYLQNFERKRFPNYNFEHHGTKIKCKGRGIISTGMLDIKRKGGSPLL